MRFNHIFSYRYHAVHKEVYDWFDISFDEFGRTSTPQQTEVCQAIFHRLMENKWLSEAKIEQVSLAASTQSRSGFPVALIVLLM